MAATFSRHWGKQPSHSHCQGHPAAFAVCLLCSAVGEAAEPAEAVSMPDSNVQQPWLTDD